jgi:serine/threonine-protein kinase
MSETERAAGGRSTDPSARVGAVVDRYTLVRVLGQGGMGAVYEARHATLSRRFAIKFLLPDLASNRDILRRFENEAKAAGGLEHPNLAAVTDFGRATDGAPYIVMEYLQGEDCAKLLKRLGPLPVPRAVNIVVQACRGLAVAHQAGIVHRDLKPENLFLTDAGDGSDHVKVLDFGIAKLRVSDASVITGTGATFGTAFYMSPEQARGAGEVDARTDVWSMGVVLYELLTGRKPFVGEQFLQVIHQILSAPAPSLASLRAGLPAGLVSVVEQSMAKELTARLPSIVALGGALAPFAGAAAAVSARGLASAETAATPATGIGIQAVAPASKLDFSEPEVRFPSRAEAPAVSMPAPRRGKVGLIVAGALALVVAAAAALFFLRTDRNPPAPIAAPTAVVPPPAAPIAQPAAAPVPAAPPHVDPPPAPAEPAPRVSERSEHRPNKRPAPRSTAAALAVPPPEPAKPAPAAAPPSNRHPIEIDKGNPYGQ